MSSLFILKLTEVLLNKSLKILGEGTNACAVGS